MNSRKLWFWAAIAASLLATILLLEARRNRHPRGAPAILANLRAGDITAILFRPAGPDQPEIRAERSANGWVLTAPLAYPAQATIIDKLLSDLLTIKPAAAIGPAELKDRSDAFGFNSGRASSLVLLHGGSREHLLFGSKTAPGDQVFVQVVGREGAYVIDTQVLQYLPKSANEWRDTRLMTLASPEFDRITVTNGTRIFELHREGEPALWRMIRPFQTRANNSRIEEALQQLQALTVQQFVSDRADNADLDVYGLQPADLTLAFGSGSNSVLQLRFGKSPTNDQDLVFACQSGRSSVTTVARDILTPWRSAISDFRDPFLFSSPQVIDQIEVRGPDPFSLARSSSNSWRILPQDLPADPDQISELLTALSSLQITQYVKDVVTDADLPGYDLAPPRLVYVLKSGTTNTATSSNAVIAELQFGLSTNQPDRIFAKRADESFVYAITAEAYKRLPAIGWKLRDRQLWSLSEEDVASITIRQQARSRTIARKGPHDWALAAGSQGVINDLAIEETVRGLLKVRANEWVAFGQIDRAHYGLDPANPYQITLELKKGDKITLEFGKEASAGSPFALVQLDGRAWVLEFPWPIFRDVVNYLSVPVGQ